MMTMKARPLKYLSIAGTELTDTTPDKSRTTNFFFIQENDGLITSGMELHNIPHIDGVLFADCICTRPEFTQRGYAKSLIWHAMKYTAKTGNIMAVNSFTEVGTPLAATFSKLHIHFPDLSIIYGNKEEQLEIMGQNAVRLAVKGEKPYRPDQNEEPFLTPTFL